MIAAEDLKESPKRLKTKIIPDIFQADLHSCTIMSIFLWKNGLSLYFKR